MRGICRDAPLACADSAHISMCVAQLVTRIGAEILGSLSDLTLSRVYARIDLHPKSMLYHANRVEWAAAIYPDPYDQWDLHLKALNLRSTELRQELTTEGAFVAIRADRPEDVGGAQSMTRACV